MTDSFVRCPDCGSMLRVIDRYLPVVRDGAGNPVAHQPRPFDPDWVFDQHVKRAHSN